MNLIVSVLVIAGVLFGGGATVSAAQNELPGQPLYQLKLASEDASLWMSSNPNARIDRLMEQSQTRLQEISAMASAGSPAPAALVTRMQSRITQALQLASALDQPDATAALQRIRARLQAQERQLAELQQAASAPCLPILLQTRLMLQTQLRQAENDLGSQDPSRTQSRDQERNQDQLRLTQTPEPGLPPASPQGSCTPALDGTGEQYRYGGSEAGTPRPPAGNDNGNGNGNGDDSDSGSEPGSGTGNGAVGTPAGPGGPQGKP